MDNTNIRNLGDAALATINAATSATAITSQPDEMGNTVGYVDRLAGMLACLISVNFNFGGGGGTIKVLVDFTPDQGTTWIEVARVALATASLQRVINLSGLTPVAVYTPVALADDAVKDGILTDRCRVRILKAGTDYAGNTSLSVRLHPR